MKIELSPGESILVTYKDTDGEVQITAGDAGNDVRVNGRLVHMDVVGHWKEPVDAFVMDDGQEVEKELTYPSGACLARREQDEWACHVCGVRWAVDDTVPEVAQCAARKQQQ